LHARPSPDPPGPRSSVTARVPTPIVPLGDALVAAARRSPENVVVAFPDERTTALELLAAATEMARGLRSLGVRRGDRVGILMPNCPAFVEALFGTSLLGAVPVLINARYRTDELAYVVGNAEISVILTTDLIADRVDFAGLLHAALPGLSDADDPASLELPGTPALHACVLFGVSDAPGFLDASGLARGAAEVPESEIDDAAAAVAIRDDGILMYTSGTTAHPKGCRLSHEAVVRTAASMVERYRLTSDDVWWCPLPLCHMSGVLPLTATLLADSRFVCTTDFEPGMALRQLEQERATFHFGIFPTVNQALVDHPDLATTDLSAVRLLNLQGTTHLRQALRDAHPNATLLHAYGCTELGGIVSLTDPAMPGDELAESSGTPWPGMQVRIVDRESGLDVPVATRGEIIARGWGMFEGYLAGAGETEPAVDADGWFHTGDWGSLDELGRIHFHGRLKDMLKIGGENVAALELESFLASHPAVGLVQVVGVPDEHLEEVAGAFVELAPGAEATEDDLIAFCRGTIAGYKVPRYIRFVDEWPMSATKIQKTALRERLLAELGFTAGS
jgi:fatty-acyl-CoA synthase